MTLYPSILNLYIPVGGINPLSVLKQSGLKALRLCGDWAFSPLIPPTGYIPDVIKSNKRLD